MRTCGSTGSFGDGKQSTAHGRRYLVLVGAIVSLALRAAPSHAAGTVEEKSDHAVSAQAHPATAKLGEPLSLIIEVRAPAGTTYRVPATVKLDPFVELARTEELKPDTGAATGALQRIVLKIATFAETGALKVPSFALEAVVADGGSPAPALEVPEVAVQITSILEGVADPKPRDINGPVPIIVKDYRLLIVAGLALLFLAAAWSLRRYPGKARFSARVQPLPPPRQAYDIAREKLKAVVADDLLRQGRFYEYFLRISEIVREYVGNRYQFFALDLTTRELLMELRDRPTPGLEHARLRTLLEDADLVKFARLHPSDDQCAFAINTAFSLVETTRLPLADQEAQA